MDGQLLDLRNRRDNGHHDYYDNDAAADHHYDSGAPTVDHDDGVSCLRYHCRRQ